MIIANNTDLNLLKLYSRRCGQKQWTNKLLAFQYHDIRYANADGNRLIDFLAVEGRSLRNLNEFEPRNQYDYDSSRRRPLPKKIVQSGTIWISYCVRCRLTWYSKGQGGKNAADKIQRRVQQKNSNIPFSQFRQEYIEKSTPWKNRESLFNLMSKQGVFFSMYGRLRDES